MSSLSAISPHLEALKPTLVNSALCNAFILKMLWIIPPDLSLTDRCFTKFKKVSRWGTHVYLWQIHFDIWQNQYNIVKLKNKINVYYSILWVVVVVVV